MKWKLGLFSPAQLGFISLLPMVMGVACKRNAPRYEPEPLGCQEHIAPPMTRSAIEEPSPKDVEDLLKDIDYKEEDLILNVAPPADSYVQNDFSALIATNRAIVDHAVQDQSNRPTSNILPDRLCIFFERNRKDGSWDKRKLVGIESITIRSNPALPNSKKYCFSLTAFLVDIRKYANPTHHLIAFVKSDQNQFFYKNDSTQTPLPTTDAMRLASERGTIFFYRKIT